MVWLAFQHGTPYLWCLPRIKSPCWGVLGGVCRGANDCRLDGVFSRTYYIYTIYLVGRDIRGEVMYRILREYNIVHTSPLPEKRPCRIMETISCVVDVFVCAFTFPESPFRRTHQSSQRRIQVKNCVYCLPPSFANQPPLPSHEVYEFTKRNSPPTKA